MIEVEASVAQKCGRIRVIVQDNGPIHRCKEVQQLWSKWEDMGLYIFFLPKYCSCQQVPFFLISVDPQYGHCTVEHLNSSLYYATPKSVLISSFTIDKGEKARKLFQVLAERMDTNPELYVQMFLNIQRPHHSKVAESVLLREFAHTFRRDIWTGNRLPEVFYDSRSLAVDVKQKSSLHAKCIVVDEEFVLITSANFTEAAHERNIEAGVLLTDSATAQALRLQFDSLVSHKILRPIPGILLL
ncbi:MAG: phospholipase D-like domain-containing protein [Nostoc sp.]|uniref:phospholipase D-like domain-containing protein n=1 Tax=Nostoc sp. TaxID=1180 RepID=UPI002FF21817